MSEMIDLGAGFLKKCINCGHLLWQEWGGDWQHFTRHYHSHGYPYTSQRCRVGHIVDGFRREEGCICENPIPKLISEGVKTNV